MATANTKRIHDIGCITATFHISHPTKFGPEREKVTRLVPSYKIGKVIHTGGQRIGKFPKAQKIAR